MKVVVKGEAATTLEYCTEGSVGVLGSKARCPHNERGTEAKGSVPEQENQDQENEKKRRKKIQKGYSDARQEGAD